MNAPAIGRAGKIWIGVLILIAAACFILFVAAFFPGRADIDITYQAQQALGKRPLSDWHPPVIAVLWYALYHLTGTLGSLLVLQLAVFFLAMALLSIKVYVVTRSRVCSLVMLVALLAPWSVSQLGMLWKDTQMAAALLLATALLLFVDPRRRATLWLLLPSGLLVVFAMAARKNGLAALPPLALWAGILCYRAWRGRRRGRGARAGMPGRGAAGKRQLTALGAIGMGVLCMAIVVAGTVGTDRAISALHPVQKTGAGTQFMLDDVMFSVPKDELAASGAPPELIAHIDKARATCLKRHEPWDAYWNCYGRGLTGKAYSPIGHQDQIRRLWLQHVITHPVRYLSYRWEVYRYYLFSVRLQYMISTRNHHGDAVGLGYHANPVENSVMRSYVQGIGAKVLGVTFYPWFWLVLSLVVVIAQRWLGRFRAAAAALAASALLYIAAYFPVVPANQFRYTYWPAIAVSVALALSFASWYVQRREQKRKQPH